MFKKFTLFKIVHLYYSHTFHYYKNTYSNELKKKLEFGPLEYEILTS